MRPYGRRLCLAWRCIEYDLYVFYSRPGILGIIRAPIESIVPTTITDLFFLHDRGEKVSFYGLSVLGGNEIGPLVSSTNIQGIY